MEITLKIIMEDKTRECVEKLADALTGKAEAFCPEIRINGSATEDTIKNEGVTPVPQEEEKPKKATKKDAKKPSEPEQQKTDEPKNSTTDDVKTELPAATEQADTATNLNIENPESGSAEKSTNQQSSPIQSSTPSYSDEALKKACADASQLGLGTQIKDLIRNKYGVIKVTELPDNTRNRFIEDLRALGVRV